MGEERARREAGGVKRLHVLVEGQTEEAFVNRILAPHLSRRGLHPTPILLATKRTKDGRKFRGGLTSFEKLRRDLQRLLRDTEVVAVTTMIDYYGLPKDFPGAKRVAGSSCWERVQEREEALFKELDHPRLVPYLSLHEFEALLFVDPDTVAETVPEAASRLSAFRDLMQNVQSPEEINDGVDTHPSARLAQLAPRYRKALHGPQAVGRIGLERLRSRCPHFDRWISRLEALA